MTGTWSFTRDHLLRECERKFALTYLLNARRNGKDEILHQIAVLKSIKSIPLWKGEVVHNAIASYWNVLGQRRVAPSSEEWLEETARNAARQWEFSIAKSYWAKPPWQADAYNALIEHEFSLPTPAFDDILAEIISLLEAARSWIEGNGIDQHFLSATDRWVEPPVFGPDATGFRLGAVEVLTKVDLAFADARGHFHIYDWKTGQDSEDGHQAQLDLYILWAHLKLRYPLDQVTANVLNLKSGTLTSHSLTPGGKIARLRRVQSSVSYLASLLPADTQDRSAVLEYFDFAPHAGVCQRCAFKKVCGEL